MVVLPVAGGIASTHASQSYLSGLYHGITLNTIPEATAELSISNVEDQEHVDLMKKAQEIYAPFAGLSRV